jgi:uncharacterized lipoprotein YddW (UPF0748 family)
MPMIGEVSIPHAPREFRGVWVATVSNIDWPTEPGLSSEGQRVELQAVLDRAVALNLNAIVFQVRTGADALYRSDLEPWSHYLTGEEGHAPVPAWDPLQWLVREAHARGIEVHAWFNPFRARRGIYEHGETHISQTHPEWVYDYSEDYEWLDPGIPEVQDLSHRVIMDVVERYDIDAVHFDDYFYPYPIEGIPFPDDATHRRYVDAGGELDLADWRRQNIDRFIRRIADSVHGAKPWVRFGISPFGIWRPGHPEGVVGFDPVEGLYADARLWFQEGWVDYLSPQLYWATDSEGQPFAPLLDWWISQNTLGRHLWPGMFTTKAAESVRGNPIWPESEVVDQVLIAREREGAGGVIHYSDRAFRLDPAIMRALEPVYAERALVPATPWLDDDPPGKPALEVQERGGASLALSFAPSADDEERPWLWTIHWRLGGVWHHEVLPGTTAVAAVPHRSSVIAIRAIDRVGNESPPAVHRR